VQEQRPDKLAAEFASLREASLAALKRVSEADLTRTARHSELGVVTLGEMLYEWAAHDLNHTIQAERAIMQPFISSSGLWKVYFKDHDWEAIHKP
jgi:low temperature requirement protein LtrA